MRKNIILIVAVAFLVSSCSIYKKYEPINDTRAEAKAESGSQFGELQWREVFTDAQLQGLIEKALQNNAYLHTGFPVLFPFLFYRHADIRTRHQICRL